jgi:hypothetical protein
VSLRWAHAGPAQGITLAAAVASISHLNEV